MFSKTTFISTLLGAVALNLLGYAFYEYLAGSYFEAHHNISMEGNMDPMFITIGSIIFAYGMETFTDIILQITVFPLDLSLVFGLDFFSVSE